MRPKLTIIVTCTDRKSAPPRPNVVCATCRRSVDARLVSGWQRLAEPSDSMPLRRLYRGEAWSQVAPLEGASGPASSPNCWSHRRVWA